MSYSLGHWQFQLVQTNILISKQRLKVRNNDTKSMNERTSLPMQEAQEMRVPSLGWEDSPEKGNGYPLQYSCMGNPMDRGAWRAIVHGITKNRTQLSDWSCVQFTSSPYSKFVYLPKTVILIPGLPWWLSGKEPTCQCRRHRFNPWSGKTLHAKGQLRLCATTIEPVFQSAGAATTKAYILYSLCFARREATTVTSPCTATRVVPTRLN